MYLRLRYLPAIPVCGACLPWYLLAVPARLRHLPGRLSVGLLRLPAVPLLVSACVCFYALVAIACRNYVHYLLVAPACVVMPAYGTCLLCPWSATARLQYLLAVPATCMSSCRANLLAVPACCTCLLYVYMRSLALLARYACLRCIFLSCTCPDKSACCAVSVVPACHAHMPCLLLVRASRRCLSCLPTMYACDVCLRCA